MNKISARIERESNPRYFLNIFSIKILAVLFCIIFLFCSCALKANAAITDNLQSYWKLDEASGTRLDSVGSNNLTDNNTVTQAVGKLGNAALFTLANSEYLSINDNASLSTGGVSFTISAWVYLNSKSSAQMVVSKFDTTTATGEYGLYYSAASDRFKFSTYGTGATTVIADSLGTVSTDTWYFIVATHNAVTNTNTIRINDTYENSIGTAEHSDSVAPFYVGRIPGSNFYANSRIDSIGFWKRVLTSQEIGTLYNSGAGLEYPFSLALAAGTISLGSKSDTTVNLTSTDATLGTAPYTYQWYRATSTSFTPGAENILSGETSLTLADTGLTASTTYYYKIRFTDSASATVDSTEFSVTTDVANATGFTFVGPSSSYVNQTSTNFTITPNGTYTGVITPSTSGTGTFSPTSLSWTSSSIAKTFTYTPTNSAGSPHLINATSTPAITNLSGDISYTVIEGTVIEGTVFLDILSTGQSLSTGWYSGPAISTTQPYNNMMLTNGVESTSAPLVPLIESGNGEAGNVETISSGMANALHILDSLLRPVVVNLHGKSGFRYSDVKKGTTQYNKGMLQASTTKSYIENTLKQTYLPIAVTAVHGEGNYSLGTGLAYESNLVDWQADYQNDLNTLNNSSTTIPLFINQMNSAWTGEIASAQLNAHINNPGKIVLVEPKYQYTYSDHLHVSNNIQQKHMGEMFAKVINKVVLKGQVWNPLMPSSVNRIGAQVTVSYLIATGTLAIDTTNVAQRPNYGFEFVQTGGNSVSISSVALVNNNSQVLITLSGVPTGTDQRVRYAWSCPGGYGTWCAEASDGTRVGGNIRDTDNSTASYSGSTGLPLYDWSVAFDQTITTDTTPPSLVGASSFGAVSTSSIEIVKPTEVTENGSGLYQWQVRRNSNTELGLNATSTNTVTDSDLSSNTQYTYDVQFNDYANNVSSYGTQANKYTLAPTPTNLSTTAIEKTSITLTVDSFVNNTASSSGYLFSRDGTDSSWIQINSWTDTGLTCNTSYTYSVKYRNGDGVETDPISITQKTAGCGGGGRAYQICTYTYSDWGSCIRGEKSRIATGNYTFCANSVDEPLTQACIVPVATTTATSTVQIATTTVSTTTTATTTISNPNSGSLSDFINLLINLGIISQDKADQARVVILSQNLPSAVFTSNLYLGIKSEDVRRLQTLLATKPDIYPESKTTGYFGQLTKKAVQRFQLNYKVVNSKNDAGFGIVGPNTRAKLKEIFGNNI
jgi:hypothetical protein